MSEAPWGEERVLAATLPSPQAELRLTPEQQRRARVWLAMLGVLGTASLIGTAFSLYLVTHQPLLLVLLSPLGRHLVLAAPRMDPVVFIAVGTLRRMAFYVPCFQLGRELGAPALVLLEQRFQGVGMYIELVQRIFSRASHAVVFFLPGPIVSTLAGISGMRHAAYLPLAVVGLCVRMLLVIAFAGWAAQPIALALAFIERHWIEGTGALLVAIALYQWLARRRSTAV